MFKSDKDESFFERGLYKFPEAGIYSVFGPEWATDLSKMRREFSKEVCGDFDEKLDLHMSR